MGEGRIGAEAGDTNKTDDQGSTTNDKEQGCRGARETGGGGALSANLRGGGRKPRR